MSPYIVAFVFARGGSQGVPRKNLRLLAGKPLLAHAIETARASKLIDRVLVSTDDEEIAVTARAYGAEVPFMRPPELATSEAPELLAWRHALVSLAELEHDAPPPDVLVSVPATAPLRAVEDVDACIRTLLESDADIVLTVAESARSPYFNMVALDEHGYARVVVEPSERRITRRQDAPATYDITTVAYAMRPAYVMRAERLFDGKVRTVLVPPERALDIDTELDLTIAGLLLANAPPPSDPGGSSSPHDLTAAAEGPHGER